MFQVRSEVTNSSRVKSVSKILLLKGAEMCLLKWSRWIHKNKHRSREEPRMSSMLWGQLLNPESWQVSFYQKHRLSDLCKQSERPR